MMIRHGILSELNNESRLDDGTLLANCAASNPVFAARPFLQDRQCMDGDFIVVTGVPQKIGNVVVFCMEDAKPVGTLVPNLITFVPKSLTSSPARDEAATASSAAPAPAKISKRQSKKDRAKRP